MSKKEGEMTVKLHQLPLLQLLNHEQSCSSSGSRTRTHFASPLKSDVSSSSTIEPYSDDNLNHYNNIIYSNLYNNLSINDLPKMFINSEITFLNYSLKLLNYNLKKFPKKEILFLNIRKFMYL